MSRFVRNAFMVAAGTTVGITSIFTTLRDGWPDLIYDAKKLVIKAFTINSDRHHKPRVLVLGSGWAALSLLERLDADLVDVTVVSPRSFFFYTPLLAGVSTGSVAYPSITESIRWHLRRLDAKFLQAWATDVDFGEQKVMCSTYGDVDGHQCRSVLEYDHLVVAVGAEPNTFNIPGVKERALMMKEVEDSLQVQRAVLEQLEHANALLYTGADAEEVNRALHWVVVGGGPTGVELVAELCDFVQGDINAYFPHLQEHGYQVEVTLVEGMPELLRGFQPQTSQYARSALERQGAKVLTSQFVTEVDDTSVKLTQAQTKERSAIDYGILIWAGGIAARPFTQKLARSIGGPQVPSPARPVRGLTVDTKFRVKGDVRNVWALGDCALTGCPPCAQAAYQQGMYLGRMFRDTQLDEEKIDEYKAFEYQDFGALAYVGASKAVADLKFHLWGTDTPAGRGQEVTALQGTGAFQIWRSLYFSKMMSNRNRFQVAFDWTCKSIFGREISTPYIMEDSGVAKTDPSPQK